MNINIEAVKNYLIGLQDKITSAIEQCDGGEGFLVDNWDRPGGGGGRTRVLTNGTIFEQAGVNFSEVLAKTCQHPPPLTVLNWLDVTFVPWAYLWSSTRTIPTYLLLMPMYDFLSPRSRALTRYGGLEADSI